MKSLTYIKEVQALNDKLATLTWFISKSVDNHAPFFNLLKKKKAFEWTNEYKETFEKAQRLPSNTTNLNLTRTRGNAICISSIF